MTKSKAMLETTNQDLASILEEADNGVGTLVEDFVGLLMICFAVDQDDDIVYSWL